MLDGKSFLVASVFCPPRFEPLIQDVGGSCRSYDKLSGYDFTKADVRAAVKRELAEHPPDLLVVCPPCTDEGGWFSLHCLTMEPQGYLRRVRQSRLFVRWEHPKGSKIWNYPEVRRLVSQGQLVSCHMCRYKAIQLLLSHDHMKTLAKECPGKQHPSHVCHQPIAGSDPEVGSISAFAGKYTSQFVEAVMSLDSEPGSRNAWLLNASGQCSLRRNPT